jgi:resuscitation-promoting factor RpfB
MRTGRHVMALLAAAGAVTLALGGCGTSSGAGSRMPVAQQSSVTPASGAAPAASTTAPSATSTPTASVTTRIVTEVVAIPFEKRTVEDATVAVGTRTVRTAGVAGAKTVFYLVTLTDGAETGRTMQREEVTRQPVAEVTVVGTKQPAAAAAKPSPSASPSSTTSAAPKAASSGCDPNYAGACVPIASDVDCSSGKGDGPAYVVGPVRVIGKDIYKLDADGDGIGCEKG